MPTYEYACTACDRHFEVRQSFEDAPLQTCEVCSGRLRRVIHPVGISFKGSGFYSTDARSDRNRARKAAESASRKNGDKSGGSDGKAADSATKSKDAPAATKDASSKSPAAKKSESK